MYCSRCMKKTVDGSTFCAHCGQNPRTENLAHQLQAGTILYDRYLVGNVLGEGGFGITYIGFDQKLEMRVAIKEFYPNGYANRNNNVTNDVTLNVSKDLTYFDNAKEKFLREAQSIAKFSNERGIVDVRDYFEENGTAYIIMEYLDGMDLARRLKKYGVFDPVYLFKQMIPVMHSLSVVHKDKVIHRDIAPDNIKMAADGSMKVFDFGAARYYKGANKKTMSVTLKQGFTPYEQYANKEQGPWTDVYGLCATIYMCITGKTPVDALERLQNDSLKRPSELGIKMPVSLENVLMYGLAVYPDNRCRSMNELIDLTDRALRGETIVVGGPSAIEANIRQAKQQEDEFRTMYAGDKLQGGYRTQRPVQEVGRSNPGVSRSMNQGMNQSINKSMNQSMNTGMQKTGKKGSPAKNNDSSIKLLVGVLAALVILIIVLACVSFFGGESSDKKETESGANKRKVETVSSNDKTSSEEDEDDGLVLVSDVSGMKLESAKEELTSKGLKVKVEKKESTTVKAGYVISQSVANGQKLKKGDTITLTVAKEASKPKDLKK